MIRCTAGSMQIYLLFRMDSMGRVALGPSAGVTIQGVSRSLYLQYKGFRDRWTYTVRGCTRAGLTKQKVMGLPDQRNNGVVVANTSQINELRTSHFPDVNIPLVWKVLIGENPGFHRSDVGLTRSYRRRSRNALLCKSSDREKLDLLNPAIGWFTSLPI